MAKKITDLEVAEFVGVSDKTIRNWREPQEEDGVKFYPPYGRHNLLKGAKIATYLLKYEDNGEEAEHFNRLEILRSNIEALEDYLKIIERDDIEEHVKKSLIQTARGVVENVTDIVKNIPDDI